MKLMHTHTQQLAGRFGRYSTTPCSARDRSGLGSHTVVLCVDADGPMRLQDYLTPEQADQLAEALQHSAQQARRLANPASAVTPRQVAA